MDLDDFSWSKLNIDKRLIEIVSEVFGFPTMTLVQKATIPLLTNYKDVCCEACTGSGKSLAFIISILQILIKAYQDEPFGKFYIGALIISPTRELSKQTFDVLKKFLDDPRLSFLTCQLFIGGNNPMIDGDNFLKNGGNILVVTPGRFSDLLERSPQICSQLKKCLQILIIDETDVLLDMGFDREVNRILTYLPKLKRTGLFSATQTRLLTKLVKLGLRNPVRIEIKEKNFIQLNEVDENLSKEAKISLKSTGLQISPNLNNYFTVLESNCHKIPFLFEFLKKNPSSKCIVFFSTCAQVDHFSKVIEQFNSQNIPIFKIHRKLKSKRQKLFNSFKNSEGAILLATDIMSRGIDIPEINWVINLDLPNTLQNYIHRSGRSGHQVGVNGNSLVICLPHELKFVEVCQAKGMILEKIELDLTNIEENSKRICNWLKDEARKSALSYEKGIKSYVSFIRTYASKNIMGSLFLKDLDFIDLANSFGLLKIPSMPELKRRLKYCKSQFDIREGDKEIVEKHVDSLKRMRNTNKKEKINKLKVTEQRQKMKTQIESCKLKGKKKKRFIDHLEFMELQEDARIVKKLKNGIIKESDFEKHFGIE